MALDGICVDVSSPYHVLHSVTGLEDILSELLFDLEIKRRA